MTFMRTLISTALLLLLALIVLAQTPGAENKHFVKDGLSFDYPANWQISDQSTPQMQFIQLVRGELEVRVRVPREWLKTPEKEAQAKKIFQDQYVQAFVTQLEQAGLHPKSTSVTTQIAGGPAEGTRVRAVLDGDPGGMDSYYRMVSDRLVHLSIIGSGKRYRQSDRLGIDSNQSSGRAATSSETNSSAVAVAEAVTRAVRQTLVCRLPRKQ